MSYKTILVHLHDNRRALRLLDAVVPIARHMSAHLIGLCVLPPFTVIPSTEVGGATVTVEEHRDAYRNEMASLKDAFLAATSNLGLQTEWRETDAGLVTAAGLIVEQARAVDLVIASQQDHGWAYSRMLEEPGRIAIECGRPLLLVPNSGFISVPARRITVAWNGRRESARAVFDALPLLKLADNVNIVWINPDGDRTMAGNLPTAEICAALARHGVKCQGSQVSASGIDVGLELLRQAAASGSELLVMGCYGHSRWREFILGGASRDVLREARLPVLLSH